MKKQRNIFLVGPMGVGKTTLGKYIAKSMQRDFFDTDQEIEARTGVDVAWIFDVEGEKGFRIRESEVIDELSQMSNIVLATGGGAVTTVENRGYLTSRGIVFYLRATIAEQVQRTLKDKRRPLLQTENRQQRIIDLDSVRHKLYTEVADFIVDTDGRSVKEVANEVMQHLQA